MGSVPSLVFVAARSVGDVPLAPLVLAPEPPPCVVLTEGVPPVRAAMPLVPLAPVDPAPPVTGGGAVLVPVPLEVTVMPTDLNSSTTPTPQLKVIDTSAGP